MSNPDIAGKYLACLRAPAIRLHKVVQCAMVLTRGVPYLVGTVSHLAAQAEVDVRMMPFFANSFSSLWIASACFGAKRCCLTAMGKVCSSIKGVRNSLIVHGLTRSRSSENRPNVSDRERSIAVCGLWPSLS